MREEERTGQIRPDVASLPQAVPHSPAAPPGGPRILWVEHLKFRATQPWSPIVGVTLLVGAASFERSRISKEGPPCIEKIEHFGFVLPVIQL